MRQLGCLGCTNCKIFQSTHPMRGATRARTLKKKPAELFQSTHPMRGATREVGRKRRLSSFQSTHPMRGATYSHSGLTPNLTHFNPHTPCGVRPTPINFTVQRRKISIHTPHAGCDLCDLISGEIDDISIHTPHAGCDHALQ